MVDICRHDGTPCRNLRAHKLRRNLLGKVRAERLSAMLAQQQCVGWILGESIQLHRFAEGDKLHLGRGDALTGVVQLADILTIAGAARRGPRWKTQLMS